MEPTDPERGHVAVVFVHGMGEPRRYADTAVLASRLAAHDRAKPPLIDLVWDADGPRARTRAVLHAHLAGRDVVFHDVYWAPLVAGKTNIGSLVRWLFTRAARPWTALSARWAAEPEIKVGALQEDKDTLTDVERAVLDDYLAYSDEVRTRGGSGKEGGFDTFVQLTTAAGTAAGGAAAGEARGTVAEEWHGRFVGSMIVTMARIAPLLLALLAALVAWPLTVGWLVDRAVHPSVGVLDGVVTLLALAGVVGAIPLARLLVLTLGDVEVYATYIEASERYAAREAVLAEAVRVLSRALADESCARAVIVGHSLGSVIVWDSLRALALEQHANGQATKSQLAKISRVVTFGSPVDKIRFFHFMDDRNDPTFAAVLEAQRVDTRFGAFGEQGGLGWDNYHDPADLVGGRLESPNDRAMQCPVRNVAVRNGAFPNPFTSHVDYLKQPVVLAGLLEAIGGRGRPDPSPPKTFRTRAWWTAGELAGPAILLFAWVFHVAGPLGVLAAMGSPGGIVAVVLLLAILVAFF